MNINLSVLKNFNLFVNGGDYAGKTKSITPPKLAALLEEYRGAGMLASASVRMGWEQMEADFTLVSFEPAILKEVAHMTGSSIFEFRGALVNEKTGETKACVITISGFISEADLGGWESGKLSEQKFPVKCDTYKMVVDDEVIYDIDIPACKAVIGGVDQYEEIRKILQIG